MSRVQRSIAYMALVLFLFGLQACSGSKRATRNVSGFEEIENQRSSEINAKIISGAALAKSTDLDLVYLLGAGDVIEISVFQVEELNTKVRINGRGDIMLPLLGPINVKGKSLSELETILVDKLSADYLQNPQVSLFVSEYRSQQIAVMGAVENPDVYSVRQSRSIFEMLSLAGGLADTAADKIRVKTVQVNPSTGQREQLDLLLSLNDLLAGVEEASAFRLHNGDSILVPEAGVIYVEGAVRKPGSFKMDGETNVLKAIALAGGVPWEGKETKIQVVREIGGEPISVDVNLDKIRKQKGNDVVLKDGDVVVVGYSATKRAISGFFKTAGQIFGYSLNR